MSVVNFQSFLCLSDSSAQKRGISLLKDGYDSVLVLGFIVRITLYERTFLFGINLMPDEPTNEDGANLHTRNLFDLLYQNLSA